MHTLRASQKRLFLGVVELELRTVLERFEDVHARGENGRWLRGGGECECIAFFNSPLLCIALKRSVKDEFLPDVSIFFCLRGVDNNCVSGVIGSIFSARGAERTSLEEDNAARERQADIDRLSDGEDEGVGKVLDHSRSFIDHRSGMSLNVDKWYIS